MRSKPLSDDDVVLHALYTRLFLNGAHEARPWGERGPKVERGRGEARAKRDAKGPDGQPIIGNLPRRSVVSVVSVD